MHYNEAMKILSQYIDGVKFYQLVINMYVIEDDVMFRCLLEVFESIDFCPYRPVIIRYPAQGFQ